MLAMEGNMAADFVEGLAGWVLAKGHRGGEVTGEAAEL